MRPGKALVCLVLSLSWGPAVAQKEESKDYFRKWLEQDVVYIITPEEREVLESLTTAEEKERFVEQFWQRRDPEPRTAVNEFKEEHYRRIAYANERFQSGMLGWKSDRGRIYIIHGPPDEIVSYPSGGPYLRQTHEGGGQTSTYPFEVWRYRHILGVGEQIELEFVDPSWSGEYRLASSPDEKDALLRVPGAGPTLAEQLGIAQKRQRPFFQPGNRETYPLAYQRAQDSPFARYEQFARVQAPQAIQFKDLQEIVDVKLTFDQLPLRVRADYFHLDSESVLVPVTVEVENRHLTFQPENGNSVARLELYGRVVDITGRVTAEFEDELLVPVGGERSTYQRLLVLQRRFRHRIEVVIKDVHGGKIGVARQGLIPPADQADALWASSPVLSDLIVPASADEMFVLGDLKVRPSAANRFSKRNGLGLYLQIYNLGIDQSSQSPSLEVRYTLSKEGDTLLEITGEKGQGVRIYPDQRAVLVKTLPIESLLPGSYRLEVRIQDRIKGQAVTVTEKFELTG